MKHKPTQALRPLPLAAMLAVASTSPLFAQDIVTDQALPEITVKGAAREGSVAKGYRNSSASQVGALGGKDLLDTPFSINVVSQELIQNLQASKPDDVLKINPVLQLNNPQSRFFTGVSLRGFGVGSNKRVDGLPNSNMIGVDMEDKERIEVLTGLSGFLYGPGAVGGTLNYVLKRPTYVRLNSVTMGITSGSNAIVQGDFGGPIDEAGKLAYRLNVAAQDGDTSVDFQSLSRQFVSGALDWNISDRLHVQFDASSGRYHMRGTEAYWATSNNAKYPNAPDASQYWGQPFTATDTTQEHAALRLNWKATEEIGVRTGYAHRTSTSELTAANNTFTAANGIYKAETSTWEYPDITNDAAYAYLDASFSTGVVKHKLTAGVFGDVDERTNYRSSAGGWAANSTPNLNLSQPYYQTTQPLAPVTAKYLAGRTRNQNIVLGDDIQFSERWSALLGFNQARIATKTYAVNGAITAYDKIRITPSASVLFKPMPNLTLYTSYIEGLEKGGTAGPTYNSAAVVNAGMVMPPIVSKQVEGGLKAIIGDTLLTAALFEIDKGLEYYDATDPARPIYVQNGRQVHRGLELTATGRLTRQITVVGGLTLLDAEVQKTQNPAHIGKAPINVAEQLAKVYVEYALPSVPGLTLSSGVYYTGKQAVDPANLDFVPDFATVDVGARYQTKIAQLPLTLRLNVSNIGNKSYWLTPNALGAARTVALSAQVQF